MTAPAPLIGPADGDRLHVMTFNLRYDRSAETRPGDPDHWPDRAPAVAELLSREQPTLLGVQEPLFSQLAAVRQALPGHEMYGIGRGGGSHGEHCAIFYDPQRLTLLSWEQIWLSDTPYEMGSATWGNTCSRFVVLSRLRDERTGAELVMANTHLDHEVEEARRRGARMILDLLGKEEYAGLPTILTGDFNSAAHDAPAYDILTAEDALRDTWDAAEHRRTPEWGTFPDYRDPVEGAARIDWILASPGVRSRAAAINVSRGSTGAAPTDHAPVQALLSLP